MKIAFGCDHAGFDEPKPFYKPEIVTHLEGLNHEVIDCGTNGPDSVDYPDFADRVSESYFHLGVSTSANRSGQAPAASLHELELEGISVGIDGGRIEAGLPSTVFDPKRKAVLREGAITAARLESGRLLYNE